MMMLAKVVEYLKSNGVAFRLASYASPELEPPVAHVVSPGGSLAVDTHVLLIDGRLALACVPRGEKINLSGLRATLPADLIEEEGGLEALPSPFVGARSLIPPLGGLFGALLLVDHAVLRAPVICFEAFATGDIVEMSYDDLARVEQPRVEAVAIAGELPPADVHQRETRHGEVKLNDVR